MAGARYSLSSLARSLLQLLRVLSHRSRMRREPRLRPSRFAAVAREARAMSQRQALRCLVMFTSAR